jgi:hypothetical protein
MPVHSPDFPFAYRLPTDVAAGISGTAPVDTPPLEAGSPRRRLAVLVLVLGVFGAGLAAGLPTGSAEALRTPDCGPGWVVDAHGVVSADENRTC